MMVSFLKLELRDKIIQIGTTYTYLGESIPYRQHIACLGETANVDGAVVEWYDDEREMVEAWKRNYKIRL